MTTVVVAPDKFRGSISAVDAAAALGRGIHSVLPDTVVSAFPIADGGEGTVDLLLSAGFEACSAEVTGPLGLTVRAVYAVKDGTAVIEAAAACGTSRLPDRRPTRRTALTATSAGVGELIAHAAAHGAQRIVVGLGGTCCTDGGAGALASLGAVPRTADGSPIGSGGAALADVVTCDLGGIGRDLDGVQVVVACDVDSPLGGPQGAARMFAPQKGASPDDVAVLEGALGRWADALAAEVGTDTRDVPGTGAAGGLAFGLHAALKAPIVPGADLLMELVGFDDAVAEADVVIVGEGSLDEQSLRGKGPVAVARAAARQGKRVIGVSGQSTLDEADMATAGIDRIYTLIGIEPDVQRCMTEAESLLERIGAMIAEFDIVGGSHRPPLSKEAPR